MARLRLVNIHKQFGNQKVIEGISLDVAEGEFLTLLGPSGCGKTTTLKIIAGFVQPDEGEIYFDDDLVNTVPPNKRSASMCFQTYALFPDLTGLEKENLDSFPEDSSSVLLWQGLLSQDPGFSSLMNRFQILTRS